MIGFILTLGEKFFYPLDLEKAKKKLKIQRRLNLQVGIQLELLLILSVKIFKNHNGEKQYFKTQLIQAVFKFSPSSVLVYFSKKSPLDLSEILRPTFLLYDSKKIRGKIISQEKTRSKTAALVRLYIRRYSKLQR